VKPSPGMHMSKPVSPPPVVLILGTLHTDFRAHEKAMQAVSELVGPLETHLGPFDWEYSQYYEPEMGPGIVRNFYAFRDLIGPEEIVAIKLATNDIEDRHLKPDKGRSVNLDPGYVSRENLVLATAKPRHQRVYIGKGIYGDLTMTYHTGSYQPLPWTYPDWADDTVLAFLGTQRERLKAALKRR
jgi:hypothetical protein